MVLVIRQKELFLHPWVVGFGATNLREVLLTEPLPVQPPTVVTAFRDIQRPFHFTGVIAIVIHTE